MNCRKMEDWILPYLDGRLKAGELRKAEEHLAACAACRRRTAEFRAVTGLLDEMPKIAPSQSFDARLQARIAAEPAREAWWAWLAPAPRVAFAASLLGLLFVWAASRPQGLDSYPHYAASNMRSDDQLRMVRDLPVLEDYDVLVNFEPLAELSSAPPPEGN